MLHSAVVVGARDLAGLPARVFLARDAAQLAHDVPGREALLGQLAVDLEGFAIGEHISERSGGRLLLLRCLGHGMTPWRSPMATSEKRNGPAVAALIIAIDLNTSPSPGSIRRAGNRVEAPVDRAVALIELEELAKLAIVQAPVDLDRPILAGDLHPCGDFADPHPPPPPKRPHP